MKNNIYVLGSINVDLVINAPIFPSQGETVVGKDFLINSGGKGANQAVAAKKLGANVNLIGAVGNDQFAQLALKEAIDNKVDISNIVRKDSTTGVAMIIKHDGDNRIILDSGSNELITKKDLIEGLKKAKENDIFISQFEVNESAVYEGLEIAKNIGMITILNPAPAKIINDDVYKNIDYLVINQSESLVLTNIYPNDYDDVLKVFEYFKTKGLKHLIVTLGSKGSVYLGSEIFKTNAYEINPVDTTGAGDSFIGAFAYGLSKGINQRDSLELANATSALVCLKEGAQQSMPNFSEVEKFMRERGKKDEKKTNNH